MDPASLCHQVGDDTDGCLPVFYRQQQSPDALESSQLEEEVDELSLIDHSEIMARLTLKQEVGSLGYCSCSLVYSPLRADFLKARLAGFPDRTLHY